MKFHTFAISALLIIICQLNFSSIAYAGAHDHGAEQHQTDEIGKGPNKGRMLRFEDFAIELTLFERGVPPEFRVFASYREKSLLPNKVNLSITLHRLGGIKDVIQFTPEQNYLRGDTVIYEPHSFEVEIYAQYQGNDYHWRYDNFEGRTQISEQMANALGVETAQIGPQTLIETLPVYGQLSLPPEAVRHVQARFAGEIKEFNLTLGEKIKKDQILMVVESNESLQPYPIKAPIDGIITRLEAGVGEQTGDRKLLTITDPSQLIADLKVFPKDIAKITIGAPVTLTIPGLDTPISAQINDSLVALTGNQAKVFRTRLKDLPSYVSPGQFIQAEIEVQRYQVPMAIKTTALQSFRDFTVAYQKIEQTYEVRMLQLGRRAGDWIEVLSGMQPGAEYVSKNSYLIKADIDKSGASHDH